MQKASDGMVTPADMLQAIDELKRGDRDAIMKRLFQTNNHLAVYIEGISTHLTNQQPKIKDSTAAMMDAVKRILVIVRAMEIGHYRMWRDSIPPSSPLARLMDLGEQNGQKNDQKNI
jgi:hypothetical protein